ncbi:hypothetical protein THAOC_07845 [Thalassiosira oceanica]|uniref:SAP domain-containing protein n=1 Tax=Thalassiosira oceanica TaxID=159749 RepID=K0SWK0_THAOC|nr:hypothetical protein THAOC_07845 [Thalassiosira oceanica]|eukprot:EJK70768.1 hypothetical protein THAOC_07845 [Thalassiosira oceanica]
MDDPLSAAPEEQQLYFFDLVHRVSRVEELLLKLKDSTLYKCWRTAAKAKIKTRLLSIEELSMLLDTGVVDWDDLLMRYLESISNRQSFSETKAIEQSHCQIDDFEAMLVEFQKGNYPEGFDENTSVNKKNEWRSCLVTLAYELSRHVNLELSRGSAGSLPTRIREILARGWDTEEQLHKETIYYIAGAVMRSIEKLKDVSKDVYVNALKDILLNAVTSKSNAQNAALPSAKVEEKEKFDLYYPNEKFYALVLKIESVFHQLLSTSNLAHYGTTLVADITHALSKGIMGDMDAFFSTSHSDDVKIEVTRRIIRSYGRLRGKDFVRKLAAREGVKHHETMRSALGTAAAIASKGKSKGGKDGSSSKKDRDSPSNDIEDTPRYEYLIAQRKPTLVALCRTKKLPISGTKRVLVKRIIDKEAEELEARGPAVVATPRQPLRRIEVGSEDDSDYETYLSTVLGEMEEEEKMLVTEFEVYID